MPAAVCVGTERSQCAGRPAEEASRVQALRHESGLLNVSYMCSRRRIVRRLAKPCAGITGREIAVSRIAALRQPATVRTGQSRRIKHRQVNCKLCCKIATALGTTLREDAEDCSARGIWDAPTREATESLLLPPFAAFLGWSAGGGLKWHTVIPPS